MATEQTFIDHLHEQAGLGRELTTRKMFGEYAVYVGGKVVAMACNNQLFVKPTAEGRALLKEVHEGLPHPHAKPHFLIADELDDRETLRRLLTTTADALPLPKPKTPKRVAKATKK
jgi:TfoX/Sxy family transcriptional regulator of competence genes